MYFDEEPTDRDDYPDRFLDDNEEDEEVELDEDEARRREFENPGSALRRATPSNPRIHRCPTCGGRNRLTQRDVDLHYQCDECADAAEMGIDGPDYWEEPQLKDEDNIVEVLSQLGFAVFVIDEDTFRVEKGG